MSEPVAYINEDDGLVCAKCYKPFKTLTDEEIIVLGNQFDLDYVAGQIDFAKAILRKAQEK